MEDISSRSLSDRLKQLEELNLITRTVQDGRPPKVLYELSEKG
ncbi:MAG: winged helix-turn-helix transcriptional regulator [Candidatus Hodarchaeota archaeon]